MMRNISRSNLRDPYIKETYAACEQYLERVKNASRRSSFLSPREIEILSLASEGLKRDEIAGRLHVSTAIDAGLLKGNNGKLNPYDNITREGYALSGWSPPISGSATMPAHDVTYTAQWDLADYAIAYNLSGGSIEGTNPMGYNADSADITLINPTRRGYIFAGWMGTGLSEPTLSVMIPTGSTGNRTYSATWARIPIIAR